MTPGDRVSPPAEAIERLRRNKSLSTGERRAIYLYINTLETVASLTLRAQSPIDVKTAQTAARDVLGPFTTHQTRDGPA